MIHAEGGLVEVGAYILTHSVLSTLPANPAQWLMQKVEHSMLAPALVEA